MENCCNKDVSRLTKHGAIPITLILGNAVQHKHNAHPDPNAISDSRNENASSGFRTSVSAAALHNADSQPMQTNSKGACHLTGWIARLPSMFKTARHSPHLTG